MNTRAHDLVRIVHVGRRARQAVQQAAGRVLDRGERAASRAATHLPTSLWREIRGNVVSAILLSALAFAASAWTNRVYGKVGLTLADSEVSVVRPVAFALVVSGVVILMVLAFFGLYALFARSPGRAVALFVSAVAASGLAGSALGSGLGVVAFPVMVDCVLLFAVHRHARRTTRPHLARAVRWVVGLAAASATIAFSVSAEPMTYAEIADGGPITVSQLLGLGAPLPRDFALMADSEGERPVVILDRGVWLTVIDPCAPAPYEKTLVRYDEVRVTATTWAEARELCDK